MKCKLLIMCILVLVCTSCYEEFDIHPVSSNKLCMHGKIFAGDTIRLEIKVSSMWDEVPPSLKDTSKLNAELYVNGRFKENFKVRAIYTSNLDYRIEALALGAKYRPQEGDRIKIIVKHQDYGEVMGETEVPKAVKISDFECKVKSMRQLKRNNLPYGIQYSDSIVYLECELEANIEFEDPVETANYYGFRVVNGESMLSHLYSIYIDDPILEEYINPIDVLFNEQGFPRYLGGDTRFSAFSDHSFNGERKKVSIKCNFYCYELPKNTPQPLMMRFGLVSLTKESFDAALSEWNIFNSYKRDLGELGLGSYIWLASNVSTSGGYLYATSVDARYADLDSVVRKYYLEH